MPKLEVDIPFTYENICSLIDIYFKVRMSTLFTLTDVEESPNPDACTLCGWPDHGPKQLGRGLPWGTAAWSIVWTCFRWRKEDAICPLPLTVPISVSGLYLLRIRKVCKKLTFPHMFKATSSSNAFIYLFHCSEQFFMFIFSVEECQPFSSYWIITFTLSDYNKCI